jgi:hypothetical protein
MDYRDRRVGPRLNANHTLILALARAFRWQELLDTGKAGSIAKLARKYDVERSYVGRILAEVRDAVGHVSIATTIVYTHVATGDDGSNDLFAFSPLISS